MILECIGAYGRIASLTDWLNGKDFKMVGTGTYFSKRDSLLIHSAYHCSEIYFYNERGEILFNVIL